ncbi:MAG TPA: sulfur carrier protein ThiS, partial [Polyangia bacterium]|nr:sulfur carrier protein ThiS [Polyangia bacterium]
MNDLRVTVNGEARTAPPGITVAGLLAEMGIDPTRVAIERNQDVIPRRTWNETALSDGDHLEIVAFVGGGSGQGTPAAKDDDVLVIGGKRFHSRLLVGTGKYRSIEEGREAILRSGAEIVTVALRRVDFTPGKPNVLDSIDRARHTLLPNTAGCYTAEEAIRTCRLARELGMAEMVKLEVIGDQQTLFPDGPATLEAARILVKEGFVVLPYCMDDPILAQKLEDVGCAAVMPLAAPIGSGLGIRNPYNIRIILERAKVPIIVDAGVGTASDAAVAMELGCHGVLMNTAIAG